MTTAINNLMEVWNARPRINISGETGWDDFFADPDNANWAAKFIMAMAEARHDMAKVNEQVTTQEKDNPARVGGSPSNESQAEQSPTMGNSNRIPSPSLKMADTGAVTRQRAGTEGKSSSAAEKVKKARVGKTKRGTFSQPSAAKEPTATSTPPPATGQSTADNATV